MSLACRSNDGIILNRDEHYLAAKRVAFLAHCCLNVNLWFLIAGLSRAVLLC